MILFVLNFLNNSIFMSQQLAPYCKSPKTELSHPSNVSLKMPGIDIFISLPFYSSLQRNYQSVL